MRYVMIVGLALAACRAGEPAERYGFIARLGRDTVSVESVTRRGNLVTSDEVDRFPRVRRRHTEIELAPDGGIRRLVMDIVTPSESANLRQRRVTVTVTKDSVHITKRDSTTVRRDFATGGSIAMAHLPQMYSLYELYFAAALGRMAATPAAGDTAHLRQFYIDREFDRFPLHTGRVWRMPDGKLNISHDWLAGIGEATVDSTGQLVSYSGLRTTYKVDVTRVAEPPDVQAIGERFAAAETTTGGFRQLSVRDTARATIGAATFAVDYGRPLARGRELLGKLLPYDYVWRTGANAATQFTTSAPITLAGIRVPAGTYTLWTVPRVKRADLIVNKQTGQWGTGYDSSKDLGMGAMTLDSLETPVEQFTISITGSDARHGTLTMEWGQFRWTAPIILLDSAARH